MHLSESETSWIQSNSESYNKIRFFWNSNQFQNRYSVRQSLSSNFIQSDIQSINGSHFDVPILCAHILTNYLSAQLSDKSVEGNQKTIVCLLLFLHIIIFDPGRYSFMFYP